MPFPIVPVALGAGVLALVLFSKKKEEPGLPSGPTPLPQPRPQPAPEPPPEPVPPNPIPVPTGGAGAMITGDGVRVRSGPNENTSVVAILKKGTTVAIPDPTDHRPPTPGGPVGWFNILTPAGARGFVSAQYLDFSTAKERRMTPEEELEYHRRMQEHPRPDYVALPSDQAPLGIKVGGYGMYPRIGVHGGGGHGGGGSFHGGGFRGGFNRGFGVVDVVSPFWGGFGWPGWGWPYGYGYGYPYGYGYGYGYPGYQAYNPYLAGYEAYANLPRYQDQKARDAYAAWQQAVRAGATPEVIEHLKGQFESAIYAA
jgi:hypothetical protein